MLPLICIFFNFFFQYLIIFQVQVFYILVKFIFYCYSITVVCLFSPYLLSAHQQTSGSKLILEAESSSRFSQSPAYVRPSGLRQALVVFHPDPHSKLLTGILYTDCLAECHTIIVPLCFWNTLIWLPITFLIIMSLNGSETYNGSSLPEESIQASKHWMIWPQPTSPISSPRCSWAGRQVPVIPSSQHFSHFQQPVLAPALLSDHECPTSVSRRITTWGAP